MRILVLISMLCVGGCATTQVGRGVQTTSVGGGFVAIGSVGLAGVAIVGGSALATLPEESRQTLFLPLAIGVGVDVGLLVLGGFMMSAGGKEIDDAWLTAEFPRVVPREPPRTSRREPRRVPVTRKPAASTWNDRPRATEQGDGAGGGDDEDDDDAKPIRRLKDP
jgi:hypothetical protein